MKKSAQYSPEVRERAVRMVLDHQEGYGSHWESIVAISAKIGCAASLWRWVRQAERDQGSHPGPSTSEVERIKPLERENRELRQANEILHKASAYFAQAELDRRFKPWQRSPTNTGRLDPIHAASGRGGHRAVGGQRQGFLRQRAGGNDQRPVQGGHHSPSFVEEFAGGGAGDAGLGGLIQLSAAAGTVRKHPASGG
jgi:transposase